MLKALKVKTVRDVIRLAHAANPPQESEVTSFFNMSEHQIKEIIDGTPEVNALEMYLKKVPESQLAEMMALMWLGSGSGGARKKDYPALLSHAKSNIDHADEYLAGKISLAEFLSDGLKKLGL